MLHRAIATLLFLLVLLIVTYAVLMGAYGLSSASGDAFGAKILWRVGGGVLILLAIDLILMVGALSLHALRHPSEPDA